MDFAISFHPVIRFLMTIVLAGPRTCRVRLSGASLDVRMGVGGWAFRTSVPRGSILRAEPVSMRVWNWGAHGWKGRWLVNGSGRGLVRLPLDPPAQGKVLGFTIRIEELTISLTEPERFVEALR